MKRAIAKLSFATVILAGSFLMPAPSRAEIYSRAAVVMEAETGKVLFAKNPDLRLPPASTTKLMTAMVALDRKNLNDAVVVSRRAANVSPTKANLLAGETVSVGTLLYAALIMSANDAAIALAESAAGGSEAEFVKLMNRKAALMGLKNTKFINPNGLPGKGQYTTASDLAEIMRRALQYPEIREIIGTKEVEVSTGTGRTILLENTNKLLWSDGELIGGKTGYTRRARHCFVCAGQRDESTIIAALLGTPSRGLLWKETEELMERGFKTLAGAAEPVVYVTRAAQDAPVKKVSYKKRPKLHISKNGKSAKTGKAAKKSKVTRVKTHKKTSPKRHRT